MSIPQLKVISFATSLNKQGLSELLIGHLNDEGCSIAFATTSFIILQEKCASMRIFLAG